MELSWWKPSWTAADFEAVATRPATGWRWGSPKGAAAYALTCLDECLLRFQEKIFLRLAPARRFGQASGDSFPVLEHLFERKPRRMAWSTWRKAKANSRQRLGCLDCLQAVSPGGKCARLGQNLVGQQRHEQLTVEPGFGALRVLLGQMAELGYLLETFED